jgi:DNA-binding MarR family transcriptional regulator
VSSTVSDTNSLSYNGTIRDELEVLFEECVDLANYLKRKARQTHPGERLSASGRILLQSLQLNGPQTVPALAHLRSTSRQNIQVLVDRLATAGYVEFASNPGHRRSDFVQLTHEGEAILTSANQREAGVLAGLMQHTTESEVNDAAELLRKLRHLMAGERKRRKPGPQPSTKETPKARVTAVTAWVPDEANDELPVNLL